MQKPDSKEKEELVGAVLLQFRTDKRSHDMYEQLKDSYSYTQLRETFISLRKLGYLVRTNPRGAMGATFCITKSGRRLMYSQYGIDIPHPDGVTE